MIFFKNLNTVYVKKLELVVIRYLCVVKGSKKKIVSTFSDRTKNPYWGLHKQHHNYTE